MVCALSIACSGTDDTSVAGPIAGSAGFAGEAGTAGFGGEAGSAGFGGEAGTAGFGGEAGTAGFGGEAGSAGSAGQAGNGGAGGTGGSSAAPTCAEAGGNRCAASASACSGLTTLASSDCAACCKVPDNPVFPAGWADPYIARDGQTYYTFATGNTVRRRSSKNLVNWSAASDALTSSPWKSPSFGFWAPAVYQAKSGKWILFYASERKGSTQKCIGRAVANSITGKFVDNASKPFICRTTHWSIDPSVFRDADGKDYLLWRQDTSAMNKGNAFIQRLDADGKLTGQEHQLISRATSEPSWEFDASGGVLENPAMIHVGGFYHLFYSGFRWETAKYANGHAICQSPLGPCTKTSKEQPWLGSQGQMAGPGGLDFVTAPDGTLLTYMHGWIAGKVGDAGGRKLWLYRMKAAKKNPTIADL